MRFELSRRSPNSWIARIVLDDGSVGVLGTPCADVESCLQMVEAIVGALRDAARNTRHVEGRAHAFTLRDERGATIAEVVARADAADAAATLAALRQWARTESQFRVTVPGEPRARRRRAARAVQASYALDEPSRSQRTGLEVLQRASDGLHSAHVNDADGRPLLYLPGFPGRRQRDTHARSLLQALGDPKRYRVPDGDDSRHFVVVGRSGRELARSRVFASAPELAAAQAWLRGEAAALAKAAAAAGSRAGPTSYPLHLLSTPGPPGFQIVAATARLRHFRFNDADGRGLLLSHAYTSTKSCEAGVRAVIAAGVVRSHYRTHVASAPCFIAVLAANGQELARSRDLERAEVEPAIRATMAAFEALADTPPTDRTVTVTAPLQAEAPRPLAVERAPAIEPSRDAPSAAPRVAGPAVPPVAGPRAQQAHDIVRRHVILAVGLGLVPIPWFDAIALTAVHVDMIEELAALYGAEFAGERARTAIAALLGGFGTVSTTRLLARGLWRLVPGLGALVGAVGVPALGGAVTHALGKVFSAHFESGGTLLSLDIARMRAHFRAELDAAPRAREGAPERVGRPS